MPKNVDQDLRQVPQMLEKRTKNENLNSRKFQNMLKTLAKKRDGDPPVLKVYKL